MAWEFSDLFPAEQKVVQACAKGVVAEIDPGGPPGAREVRADLLRQLLLNLPQGAGFEPAFAVRLPGVRVSGAIITGELDLQDCSGPRGDGLPALELLACDIRAVVNLSHARLARLSFKKSIFTAIIAHGLRIDGPFDFSEAGFPVDSADALASIDLTGAIIDGEVLGRGARLRLLSREGNIHPGSMRYAFRLSDAKVHGSLNLNRGFLADGGVTISASHIAGEVWLSRATLIARESHAFNARGAVIDGPVMMIDGFDAQGRIGLRGAEIKGDLSLGQERVTQVDGEPLRDRAKVTGVLDLRGAVIAGSLELGGSTFTNPGDWAINAAGVRIGDDITIRTPPHKGEDSIQTFVSGGLRFEGADIGGEVIWDGLVFSTAGPEHATLISLADASIGRAFKPCRLELDPALARTRTRIDLSGARCSALDDDLKRGWGPRSIRLAMDGFVYARLERDQRNGSHRGSSDRWKARRKWLRERVEGDGYHPQPFAHLARVYADAGWTDDMRRVLRRQRTLHLRLEEQWWMRPIVGIHWLVAGYGYAPQQAALSLIVYLAIGWYGVDIANKHHALVRDLTPVSAEVIEAPWCHDEISAPLYALDIAIPLLDLRQESECEPGAAPGAKLFKGYRMPVTGWMIFEEVAFWRWAKALYGVLGAIMTAIAVLTFTGVLQSSRRT